MCNDFYNNYFLDCTCNDNATVETELTVVVIPSVSHARALVCVCVYFSCARDENRKANKRFGLHSTKENGFGKVKANPVGNFKNSSLFECVLL